MVLRDSEVSRARKSTPIRGKMRDMKNQFAWALLLAGLGVVLLSDPTCERGCRTVAEHLLSHGIDDFLAGLSA